MISRIIKAAYQGDNLELYKEVFPNHYKNFAATVRATLQALDISGIIDDLRFYGRTWDGSPTPDLWEDAGQRARTRLSKMGVEI